MQTSTPRFRFSFRRRRQTRSEIVIVNVVLVLFRITVSLFLFSYLDRDRGRSLRPMGYLDPRRPPEWVTLADRSRNLTSRLCLAEANVTINFSIALPEVVARPRKYEREGISRSVRARHRRLLSFFYARIVADRGSL